MNNVIYRKLQQDFEKIESLLLPWDKLSEKTIFMTGATGFIGHYLAELFCWLNSRMNLGLTLEMLHRKGKKPPFSAPCIRWIEGNITSDFLPQGFEPDIIIHMASPANSQAIQADPVGVINCNVLATRYLLEIARSCNAHFLYFSSGEIYQRQAGKIPEQDAKTLAESSTLSLYGNSKLAGELLCERYLQTYGVDCRILRLFSVYGPGEPLTSGRCFTDFLRQTLECGNIQVTGPGTQLRSFCDVSDFISGLLYILLKGESTVYNIGNEDNVYTILEKIPICTVFIELSDLLLPLEYKSRYLKVIGPENAIVNSVSTFSSGCFDGLYRHCVGTTVLMISTSPVSLKSGIAMHSVLGTYPAEIVALVSS